MSSQLKAGPKPVFTIKTDQYLAFMAFMLLPAMLAVDFLWDSLGPESSKVFPVVLVGLIYFALASLLWGRRMSSV